MLIVDVVRVGDKTGIVVFGSRWKYGVDNMSLNGLLILGDDGAEFHARFDNELQLINHRPELLENLMDEINDTE